MLTRGAARVKKSDMRFKRAIEILPALLLLGGSARAQLPDLVEVSGQYRPGAAVDDPRPTRAQVSSYDANINVPVPLGPKTFLIPGVSYHVDSVSFDDAPPGFVDLRAFHSIELPVM